ncbi:MAG: hypothetical protein ABS949_11610 [Solibacillus sp.]
MIEKQNQLIQSLIKGTKERKIDWESALQLSYKLATDKINDFEFANAYGFKKTINEESYVFIICEFKYKWGGEVGFPESTTYYSFTIHRGKNSEIVHEIGLENENLSELFLLAEFSGSF